MKRGLYNGLIIITCVITWLILKEELSLRSLIVGAILAALAFLFNVFVLHHDLDEKGLHIQPLIFPWYFINLIIQIYLAGIVTIKKIISGKINPDIVEIEVDLENDLYICFLANSITLTPGTVTVDKQGKKLKVLWLDCVTKDQKLAGEQIKGVFERILRKG